MTSRFSTPGPKYSMMPCPQVYCIYLKTLSDAYYEAINVYPPSTNDMAGFKAIANLLAAHERALLDSLLEHKHKLHSLHQCVPVSVIQAELNALLPSGGVEGETE